MVVYDYIVVGFGLAGVSFVEQLEVNNKSCMVFEDGSQQSSRVAGGVYNPVILKRFTLAWQASEQLKFAMKFYEHLEQKLDHKLMVELPVLRRFNSVEEQNLWFEAGDKVGLQEFLSSGLYKKENKGLDVPFHFGEVKSTGRIEIATLLSLYLTYLESKSQLIKESFDHQELVIHDEYVEYHGVRAKNIVFTEGYGLFSNPLFNYLSLQGNKGEYILIKSEALQLEEVVKSSIFIIPLGDDVYKVGATYNNDDKTGEVTQRARLELQKKLDRFIKVDYTIVDQVAGIRPTTRDRRPFVGTHRSYKNVHILNGLGSRGILIGPYMAEKLFDAIEHQISLDKEIDINRFGSL